MERSPTTRLAANLSQGKGFRTPLKRLVQTSWLFCKWTILSALMAAVAIGLYLYHNLNDEIRIRVQRRFAEHYHQLDVSIDSAQFHEGEGVEIRGLRFSQKNVAGHSGEMLDIDEMFVHCTTDPRDLVAGKLDVSRIVVKRVRISAALTADGKLNLESLFPLPKFGDSDPIIEVHDGLFELYDSVSGARLRLDPIDLTLKPMRDPQIAADGKKRLTVEGTLRSEHFEEAKISGILEPDSQFGMIQGSLSQLRITPDLFRDLPSCVQEKAAKMAPLEARVDLRFQVATPSKNSPCRFEISGDLSEGRWNDRSLPFPVSEISGSFVANAAGVDIERMSANVGDGSIVASLVRQGWSDNSPVHFEANLCNYVLHERLAEAIPPSLREHWYHYQPAGAVDAQVIADFDGIAWKPELHVTCLDSRFLYHRFPYPVNSAQGRIDYKNGVLDLNLSARAGKAPIKIVASLRDLGPEAKGFARFTSVEPILCDEVMLDALAHASPKASEFATKLQPRGTTNFDFLIKCHKGDEDQEKRLTLDIVDAQVTYDEFPYPIEKIHGRVIWTEEKTFIERLEGVNDSGYVVCGGTWTQTADPRGKLLLNLTCTDIPLEDELRSALPSTSRRVWDELRPRGTIDHMDLAIAFPDENGKLDVDIRAQKWRRDELLQSERKYSTASRTISIEPRSFPWLMDEVVGAIQYRRGVVHLLGVTARHGNVQIATGGDCQELPDGRWQLRFQDVQVDRLFPERDLLTALPANLAASVRRLKPSTPVNMRGAFTLIGGAQENAPPDAYWDLDFFLAGCDVTAGVLLNRVYGAVRLTGEATSEGAFTFGELSIDSLLYNNIPLTKITGPLFISSQHAVIGSQVPRREGKTPRSIVATTFGGQMAIDSSVLMQENQPFSLEVKLTEGSLEQTLLDLGQANPGRNTGRLFAEMRLAGNSLGTHTFQGNGRIQLRDGNLYQLPLAVSLLKVLAARAPDNTAFHTSDIDFQINGDYVYMNRMTVSGDAISLTGAGEANLDGRISMRFYTELGNNRYQIPVIRPLLGEAGRNFMVIHVNGTIDHPETQQEIFPVMNEALEQLFPEQPLRFGGGLGEATGGSAARQGSTYGGGIPR
ncbi:AsmA-like C-terminal domain-containing protein [Blastopirellula sp. JC732]|uniref:AsmA-like C-terminal domain-containing protein n=1 Tax=Blastopirellula sediminis TaxID=2894196 RepID=A0A9X1MSD7_9BACT|nr:AsmA-like C-terminal domain-containing protein [Blastopirellula sediminis]MCC9604795.1 AsmA-like C-terminal domain-containing protein [Blastopirellula sediminis]MCC9631906.1 AsmA-like C-terminal domain-containing protein [Blastopirellula sediminis]